MLEDLYLVRSKIRKGIFAIFFTNPNKKYYLRELERFLGYSAGSIRRELLRFQKDGLFFTEHKGNLLYYALNQKHPLFSELRSIVFKTIGVEGALRKELSGVNGVEAAFIYGSFASQKEQENSDIDLMIIGNPDSSLVNERLALLERKLKREIHPTFYSPAEYKAKKKSGSGFIKDVLGNPKVMLVGRKDDL